MQLKAEYDRRIREAETSICSYEKEASLILESRSSLHEWIREFKEYRNIRTLDRNAAVVMIKKVFVYSADRMAQKLSELAAVQATYEAEYAGSGGMAETIEQYAGFQELSSEIVHALVKRIVFFGEGRIEIGYTFADEMKGFVELAECRKGEVSCTKEETV